MFNYVGIRKHGVGKYLKMNLIPPDAAGSCYILITPLEFLSTFILRPFTLALRLFANMFAGHMILLVFTLGGFVLLGSSTVAHQADLARVLGAGDRADVLRGADRRPAGLRLHPADVELHPGFARRRALGHSASPHNCQDFVIAPSTALA